MDSSHVTLLKELAYLGKELGYKDVELNRWVTAQVKMSEDKVKAEQQRLTEEARQADERARAAEDREERRSNREHEKIKAQLEIKKMELELQHSRATRRTATDANGDEITNYDDEEGEYLEPQRVPRSGPKLPFFDDTKDDIDCYLRRFERYSEMQRWPRTDWALYLSALLKGKGLECYSRLAEDEARDYDRLKTALLRQFDLTAEGFRKRFYEARRDKEETATQFVVRLVGYLDRWVQMTDIELSYEGLRGLLVRERFLDACDDRLALYLRERSPPSLDEMVTIADHYLDARASKVMHSRDALHSKKPTDETHSRAYHSNNNSSVSSRDEPRKSVVRKGKAQPGEDRVCFSCGLPGHIRRDCKQKSADTQRSSKHDSAAACEVINECKHSKSDHCKHTVVNQGRLQLKCGCEFPYVGCLRVGPKTGVPVPENRLDVVEGRIGDQVVSVLRDTGCTTGVVRSSLVKPSDMTGRRRCFRMLDGTMRQADTAVVTLQSPIFSGNLECLCVASPICDVIVGNVPGVMDAVAEDSAAGLEPGDLANAVTTRAQAQRQGKAPRPLITPVLSDLHVSVADMEKMQKDSSDLARIFEQARTGEVVPSGKEATVSFVVERGLLHRIYKLSTGVETKQLVVPQSLRKGALALAHESVMSGHLGVSKTLDRILTQFWWPGIGADVTRFVGSCDACQRTTPKGRVGKAPLERMSIIKVPFQRVGIDLVGPITPPSSSGNRFILSVVDYATRYPETVALPGISTEQVAEALCKVFSRVGVPKEILSDQGSQFVSSVMHEVYRLLSIKPINNTPYHPQTNGLVEKFNGTIKAMIKKLCLERPSDWDRYLEPALFALREVKPESLGFSPFELIYGRTVRGPMAILRELWSNDLPDDEVQTTYEYVFNLRNRMEETCKLVEESLAESQMKAKKHFDRKAKTRKLKVGDKVLILLSSDTHKMLMTWKGPYTVVECIGVRDYRIQLDGETKVFHINMLKQYFYRQDGTESDARKTSNKTPDAVDDQSNPETDEVAAGILMEDDSDDLELFIPGKEDFGTSDLKEVHICPDLSPTQKEELWKLLTSYSDIFSNAPGQTNVAEHRILLTDSNPVRSKTYPVPYSLRHEVQAELSEVVKLGIVEASTSPYSSPLLMVKKKDGTNRPMVDYRGLNRVTVFDAEPMPNADDILAKISGARIFSKLDFCKGYWQIPVAAEDKEKTAFVTPFGLYQFKRMPFGFQNAGATYGRMTRKILDGLKSTDNFVDDVLTFTGGWREQLDELREVFGRVRRSGRTVKPSKCYFGYPAVEFVGHQVGDEKLEMLADKVEQVVNAPAPRTKKQLRAFLGLAGYYRKFIQNYAEVASPLTDALKGGSSSPLNWKPDQESAFRRLKELLCQKPILRLPDVEKPFVLRTDASDIGLGAVLLQEHDDGMFPIAHASRKLTRAERNYAVVERECLAIVWAVSKFYRYLYGRKFVLQTDHRPLTFLDRAKLANARVMRWALALQPFHFRTESIKGSDNVGADYLSRVAGHESRDRQPSSSATE